MLLSIARPVASAPVTFFNVLRKLFITVQRSAALARQRKALQNLDDDALRDIGLSRSEAEAEAERPIWDAPDHWYK